ncbi:DUF354 domain-containing protein [Halosegnis marinus]|uniref:DUF354 domain-containing protein n=1 Tax=Halosegnis marinus TaxID=3034023 RepID=A0ABD5ZRY7_9EURY|nr:DUF354 domain-containing protein [Halosegnis sp. DT85]
MSTERTPDGAEAELTVAVTVQHPAHVHFYRHPIAELRRRGHAVHVFAREKDVTTDLLAAFDIDHTVLAREPRSRADLLRVQARYELGLLRACRRLDPDVLTAVGGTTAAHVGWLLGARSVVFIDSGITPSNRVTVPFADEVCNPRRLVADFGARQRRYDGYHELAYLHPDRFEPDPERLRALGVEPDDTYSVLRFVAWNAHHDVGKAGLSPAGKRRLVEALAERGDVYVTTEGPLPDEFEDYRLPVPPEALHDLLAHADLYVGDSQTTATEAALLGTPAIRSNSYAGDGDMSNFVELEDEYGLLRSIPDEDEAIATAAALLDRRDARAAWARRRDRLFAEKIDVTDFVVERLTAPTDPPTRGTRLARPLAALAGRWSG